MALITQRMVAMSLIYVRLVYGREHVLVYVLQ